MKGQHHCAFPHEPIHTMHRHNPTMRLLAARLQPKVTLYGVLLGWPVTLPPGERSGVNISKARQVRLQCMHDDCKGGLFWPGSLRIGLRSSTVAMALPTESKAQVVE